MNKRDRHTETYRGAVNMEHDTEGDQGEGEHIRAPAYPNMYEWEDRHLSCQ